MIPNDASRLQDGETIVDICGNVYKVGIKGNGYLLLWPDPTPTVIRLSEPFASEQLKHFVTPKRLCRAKKGGS